MPRILISDGMSDEAIRKLRELEYEVIEKHYSQDELLSGHDILALNDVKRVNIISRLIKSFNFLIWGDV